MRSACRIALVVLLTQLPLRASAGEDCPARVGRPAPPFAFANADGSEGMVLRAALRKHVPIVIGFWAYFCEPCRRELPMLQRLARAAGDRAIFLLIHAGPDEARMRATLAELGVTLPSASDDMHAREARYCVHELPRTFVVDRAGVIADIIDGVDEERLRADLERFGVGVPAAPRYGTRP